MEYWINFRVDLSQQTFQRCFSVVLRLIWRRDVAQRQIKVETTLCTSTLEFTTLSNVESTFYFNVDLNNVRQRRHNVDIFNVELHNVEPRWNNVVNMTIEKNEETNFESRTQ